jgi:aspartyl-tRNA(Asn)/glutamyl-tRNA(Gln) amidotransferase subunit A
MSEELHYLTIAEAGDKIARKQLSPVELMESYLRRIEAVGSQLDAFITLTADRALDQAHAAEAEIAAGHYRGPLHGIPFGLKDIYETAGILTTGHSKVMQNHVPQQDATTTARLYDAGMILLGKLASYEFTHGGPSLALNVGYSESGLQKSRGGRT